MLDKREMNFLKQLDKTGVVGSEDESMASHLESDGVIKINYKAYPIKGVIRRTLTELGRNLYRNQRIENNPVRRYLEEVYSLF